jgi:hypothetical protein
MRSQYDERRLRERPVKVNHTRSLGADWSRVRPEDAKMSPFMRRLDYHLFVLPSVERYYRLVTHRWWHHLKS